MNTYIFILQNHFEFQFHTETELQHEGIFFRTQFHSLGLIKKLEIEITKTTQNISFKTDLIKVVIVFLISSFFYQQRCPGKEIQVLFSKSNSALKFIGKLQVTNNYGKNYVFFAFLTSSQFQFPRCLISEISCFACPANITFEI